MASTSDSTVQAWMRALGESAGAPGGGAASALMLSMAAGLTSMVTGYTKPKHVGGDAADAQAQLDALHARAETLRVDALALADEDAVASAAFGAAFTLEKGQARDDAVRSASVIAATSSAAVGRRALDAIADLEWLGAHGNPALIADVAVACAALRSAIAGARTNLSFDLGAVRSAGETFGQIRAEYPGLWDSVDEFEGGIARLDALSAGIDERAAPTDWVGGGSSDGRP